MRYQALMIRRFDPGDAARVARIFAEHDQSELPGLIGVQRRTLFQLEDLYLHLAESDIDFVPRLRDATTHPLFRGIDGQLAGLLHGYTSATGTMATSAAAPFYRWNAGAPAAHRPAGPAAR
jgi:cyclase